MNYDTIHLQKRFISEDKKIKDGLGNIFNEYDEGFWDGRITAFDDVICALNTLEDKEVDLDNEKDAYICNHFSEGSDGGMISDAHREIGGVTYFDLSNIAEYFFELGLKTKKGE